MRRYDFIFVGGGLAGLSLAYHLTHSSLHGASMLIVDCDTKQRNDRTWCFWTPAGLPTPFDGIVSHEWSQIRFVGEGWNKDIALRAYRYRMIRGLDFYRFVRRQLSALLSVEFRQATVEAVEDVRDFARVTLDGELVEGRWIFDSRFNLAQFHPGPARYRCLRQYFKGWLIETPRAVFDPRVATLMDFRTPQQTAMRFFYVLPLSEKRALVEFVAFSSDRHSDGLKAYVNAVLRIGDYQILAREGGVNPLTDFPFPRRASEHVMRIGTPGGRIKPSSGYAFTRIQHDSTVIAHSLERLGHPFDIPPDSAYYRLCDTLMLDLMQHHGGQIKPIFTALFKNNPIELILTSGSSLSSAPGATGQRGPVPNTPPSAVGKFSITTE